MNNWDVLLDDNVIKILAGYTIVYEGELENYSLPLVSNEEICKMCDELKIEISIDKNISRFDLMKITLQEVIKNNKINFFFKEILKLKRFSKIIKNGYGYYIDEIYWNIINCTMIKINEVLFFDECRIDYNFKNWKFNLKSTKITYEEQEFEEEAKECFEFLNDFPEAKEEYKNAYLMMKDNNYKRNIIDSLRLTIEMMCMKILSNKRTIENNISDVCKLTRENGYSKEFVNMLHCLLDYYSKYNNNNVKHNSKVNSNEIQFIFEITNQFITILSKQKVMN